MEIFSKIKHIGIVVLKRVLIYLALSVLGWSMCFDQINSIRNEVYGIGNYLNIKACSGMLMILNGIFLAFLVLFLFQTRKLLYKSGNRSSKNFKDYVKLFSKSRLHWDMFCLLLLFLSLLKTTVLLQA